MKTKIKTGSFLICFLLVCAFVLSNLGFVAEATALKAFDRAYASAESISPEGFAGLKVVENIEKWQLSAYADNPSIVGVIRAAKTGEVGLSDVQVNNVPDFYNIYVKPTETGNVLAYYHKDAGGGNGDLDFKFANDKSAVTDWRGAKEMWVYADYSNYGVDEPKLRVSIEESDANTGARKSWRATGGVSYIAEGSSERVTATIWDNRVILPKNFKGWVCWTLNESSFEKYYNSGTASNTMDLIDVHQFQIAAFGENKSVGTEYYLDKFSIVGDVGGGALPVSPAGTESYTYKEVWSLENLSLVSYDGMKMAWYGEFAGKLLTGLAMSYIVEPSDELYAAGKKLADDLVAAQWDDGYLGHHTGTARYNRDGSNWDVWNNYHCIYGLYRWYKVSGDEKYLNSACKALDCAMKEIGEEGKYYTAASWEMNIALSHAFICLYSETGNLRYLKVAEHIVNSNWADHGKWLTNAEAGKDFYQSELPRWEALHTIMTLGGLFEATGNIRYYKAFEQIWESILKTDVHNDGAFSSGESACGDPYNTGAVESCCTIAWMAMSSEFLQVSKRSDVADELERSYFNAMLGAIMDDGRYITYDTPMNGIKVPSTETLAFQYYGGSPDFTCCQANMARGVGQIADWAVLTDSTTLYLNYYGSSSIKAQTPSGGAVTLKQETAYPSDGAIKITLSLGNKENFNLALRIPAWSKSAAVRINGEVCDNVKAGTYFNAKREWKDGDIIEINFDMSLHYWKGAKNFEGYTSVYYGPILLTLDTAYGNISGTAASFNFSDLEASKAVSENGNIVSVLTRTSDGTPLMLVDFAGAGRSRNAYASWLKVNFGAKELSVEKSIWQSRLTHSVFVNPGYVAATAGSSQAAGTVVKLTVSEGKTPIAVTSAGSVGLKKTGNNQYSFVMPGYDVFVDVI